jgi:hypothetical protein
MSPRPRGLDPTGFMGVDPMMAPVAAS